MLISTDDIEHLAYRFRIDNGLYDLPLTYDDVLGAIHSMGMPLKSYATSQIEMVNYRVYAHSLVSDAFSAYISKSDGAKIYYDDTKTTLEKRDALCHEMGHIQCGHIELGCVLSMKKDRLDPMENEAEKWRLFLIAPPRAVKERGGNTLERVQALTLLDEDDAAWILDKVRELPRRPVCDDEKQLISLMRSTRAYKRYRLNALTRLFCGLLTAMIAITIPVMGMAVVAEKIVAPPLADPYTTTCDPMRTMDDQLREFNQLSRSVYITKDNYLFHLIGCPELKGKEKMRVDWAQATDGDYYPCPDCVVKSDSYRFGY